jgi:hypothetical protein
VTVAPEAESLSDRASLVRENLWAFEENEFTWERMLHAAVMQGEVKQRRTAIDAS